MLVLMISVINPREESNSGLYFFWANPCGSGFPPSLYAFPKHKSSDKAAIPFALKIVFSIKIQNKILH